MAVPQFTGKYASIRKDVWKGTLGQKYTPDAEVLLNHQWHTYNTEKGYYNAQQKAFNQIMAVVDKVERAPYPIQGAIYIDWKKGDMGAQQAKATLHYAIPMPNGTVNKTIEGKRTGGWGYDKASSASAGVLNQSPFLKVLYDARVKKKKLPYGASLNEGTKFLPYFEGGVGIECHNDILKACGYDVYRVSGHGDTLVYTYTLKKRRA